MGVIHLSVQHLLLHLKRPGTVAGIRLPKVPFLTFKELMEQYLCLWSELASDII